MENYLNSEMAPKDIAFFVLFTLESLVIISANIFTICVIWRKITTLKRTYYFLLNLAFADVLVGVQSLYSGFIRFAQLLGLLEDKQTLIQMLHRVFAGSMSCFGTSSMCCLVVISLERLCSVLWPIYHRTAETRCYFITIAFAWLLGIISSLLYTLYALEFLREMTLLVLYVSFAISSLLIICISYFALWYRSRRSVVNNRGTTGQDRKLSATVFIVTASSLVCWLPMNIAVISEGFGYSDLPSHVSHACILLQLANSFVNPIVYSFRMPAFQQALKKCFKKKHLTERRTITGERASPGVTLNARH